MFKKIGDQIRLPVWVTKQGGDARFKQLELYDRLLDGRFYDHLHYAFYDEQDTGGRIIPLVERRPSAQFRLPRMVARWCARKLFAGRYQPKIRHEDPGTAKKATALLRRAKFFERMAQAALWGSVGAIAVTFRVEEDAGPEADPRVSLSIWRAKYCKPSFDDMGELAQLRVQYPSPGAQFKALGFNGADIVDTDLYWFIRDYLPTEEVTYKPVKVSDWNPVDGFVGERAEQKKLEPWEDQVFEHDLGFVPGHWFVNLPGGTSPDGQCTFEDAIPNSIELDYTLSQIGRGVRYNCAPTLVIIGDLLNNVTRGTMSHIQVGAGFKQPEGETTGAGDAKLLEMSGTGTTAALAMVDKLRNLALEQIAASRKDPEKAKGPLSGRAMEYMDEESSDLISELRSQYGEHGALPLLKKILLAAKVDGSNTVAGYTLQWPRLYQPTPDEVFALVQALQIAVDPLGRATPPDPGKPGAKGGMGKPATPAIPATPAGEPGDDEQFLTVLEAQTILRQALDISMMDIGDDDSEDQDVDASPTPPDEATPMAPLPADILDLPADDHQGPGPEVANADGEVAEPYLGGAVAIDA